MCGTRSSPGTRRCLSCGEELQPADDFDIDSARRQLKRWVVRRSLACGAFVFVPALVLTQPQFGMGGPNYFSAPLIAGAAAAMVGVLLAARAYLHLQRIVAERAGSTLCYWMGRQFRAKVAKRKSAW
jgi:hypothetical protein